MLNCGAVQCFDLSQEALRLREYMNLAGELVADFVVRPGMHVWCRLGVSGV